MNLLGPLLGLASLLIIGFGFFWVVRLEYHGGWTWWPYVVLAGLLLIAGSLLLPSPALSALAGSFGASLLWGSTELRNQAIRVGLGWYRDNPGPRRRPPFESLILRMKAPNL
jgi:hypothetical protein